MLEALDAAAVRRWIAACVDGLTASRAEIDEINVFPVADGDTGTNLLFTMRAALDAVDRDQDDGPLGALAAELARGALRGARGNSGVIVSQALRGIAETVRDASEASATLVCAALHRADELATAAVADPAPGTMLSVLHAAAEAARAAGAESPGPESPNAGALGAVVSAAAKAATAELAETPSQLAVLAAAGVVDAGGRGLVVLLEALARVVADTADRTPSSDGRPSDPDPSGSDSADSDPSGSEWSDPDSSRAGSSDADSPDGDSPGSGARSPAAETSTARPNPGSLFTMDGRSVAGAGSTPVDGTGDAAGRRASAPVTTAGADVVDRAPAGTRDDHGDYPYEVMYLLDGCDTAGADALRVRLGDVGDCVSVVGDGLGHTDSTLWTVHVHCAEIGPAIEAGIETGRPHRIAVTRFADQPGAHTARFVRDRAVLAVVQGEGTAELVRGEGVTATLGPVRASDLLAAITGTRARHVVLLPNDLGLTSEAEQAAEQAVAGGQDVVVVPTASPVQCLAAIAVHDAERRAGDDVVAMAEAAAATRRGELLVGDHEALTWVGRCQPGDLLGMLDGEVVLIEPASDDVAVQESRPGAEPPADTRAAASEAAAESDAVADTPPVIAAAHKLVDRMLGNGGELLTALLGADAPDGLAAALEEHMRAEHPEVEFAAYLGDEPDTVLLLGVE